VRLDFDPAQTSEADLDAKAATRGFMRTPDHDFRGAPSDDKYHLRHSPLRFVALTPAQKTRVNAALAQGTDVTPLLAPSQARQLAAVQAHPERSWPDLSDSTP